MKARKHGLSESLSKETSEDIFDMFGDDEGNAAEVPATTGNGSLSVQAVESMLNLSIFEVYGSKKPVVAKLYIFMLAGGDMQNDYLYDESSGYASSFNFSLCGSSAEYTILVARFIVKCFTKMILFLCFIFYFAS